LLDGRREERFTEDGKGKGIAGRRDVVDKSGYVSGFKSSTATGGGGPAPKAPTSPKPSD